MLDVKIVQDAIVVLSETLKAKEIKVNEYEFQELKRTFARSVGLDFDFDHLEEIHICGVRIYK